MKLEVIERNILALVFLIIKKQKEQ